MKTKKTNFELFQFQKVTRDLLANKESNETKYGKAIYKQAKVIETVLDTYNENLEDAKIEFCSVDNNGNIIKEQGTYAYTRENAKSLNKKVKELLNEQVELEVFLKLEQLEHCPKDFLDFYLEFIGKNK
jgi:hypothetical protein